MQRVGHHTELSGEEARQGHIVLDTRLKQAIFLAGLAGCALLLLVIMAFETAQQL